MSWDKEKTKKLIFEILDCTEHGLTTQEVTKLVNLIEQKIRRAEVETAKKFEMEVPKLNEWSKAFPDPDNPVRCRLCGEKVYCSCADGYSQAVQEVNKLVNQIVEK